MIVCPAVCWIWERQVISGGFGGSCYYLLHEEKRRLNKGFLLHHTSEGVYVWEKKRGGHCQPPSYRMRWDGLVLFSQATISLLILYMSMSSVIVSFPLMPSSSIDKLILSKPCRPTGTAFLLVHLCLQIPPVFFYLHFNPHLQNKQLYTLGHLTCATEAPNFVTHSKVC